MPCEMPLAASRTIRNGQFLYRGSPRSGSKPSESAHRATQPPPGQVERASLVAQTIVTIAEGARHRVFEGMRLLPDKVGLRLAVAREDRSVGQRPVHAREAVKRQGQSQRSRRQRDMGGRRRDLGRDGWPRTIVEPGAARSVRVCLTECGHVLHVRF